MGRIRQGRAGRRLFSGRRSSSRNQSSRSRSQSSTRRSAQTSNSSSTQSTRATPSGQTSQSHQTGQNKPSTKSESPTKSTTDQGVKTGTAAASKPSEESAAKQKADSLFSNMFGGSEKAEESKPTPNSSDEKKGDQGGFSLSSLSDGVSKIFSGENAKMIQGAAQRFDFDKKERERAEQGLAALKKMAGKDKVLSPEDRQNIIGQMDAALKAEKNKTVNSIASAKIQEAKNNRGPLRKALFPNAPLVSTIGDKKRMEALNDPKHMQTARNQALGQLNQGFKEMGMETNGGVSFQQGLQNAQNMPSISLEDTNAFKDTMTMVRDKAKAMGLPEGKFKEGLPVAFLEDVLAGKRAFTLHKYQSGSSE